MSNGIFNNIMSVFQGGGAQQPAQPAQQPSQQAPVSDPGAISALNPAGAPPTAGANPNSQQHQNPGTQTSSEAQSPLDQFKDLFNIEQDPKAPAEDPNASWFNLDQDKMLEAANKVSFTNVPQFGELAQKALSGDTEALGNLLDTVLRGAYVRNAMLAGTISEKAGRAALERISNELPNKVRDISSQESVAQLNPMFQHPAMRPMVDSLRQQIQRKYPDASSKEIANLTNEYLSTISKQMAASQEPDPTDRRKAEEATGSDFSNFFF